MFRDMGNTLTLLSGGGTDGVSAANGLRYATNRLTRTAAVFYEVRQFSPMPGDRWHFRPLINGIEREIRPFRAIEDRS